MNRLVDCFGFVMLQAGCKRNNAPAKPLSTLNRQAIICFNLAHFEIDFTRSIQIEKKTFRVLTTAKDGSRTCPYLHRGRIGASQQIFHLYCKLVIGGKVDLNANSVRVASKD